MTKLISRYCTQYDLITLKFLKTHYLYTAIHETSWLFERVKLNKTVYYNVTLSHVRTTIVAMEKKEVLHILSVCL